MLWLSFTSEVQGYLTVGLYIRGVPFVIVSFLVIIHTYLYSPLYCALTHTPICTEHAPEIDGSERAKDGEHGSIHCR